MRRVLAVLASAALVTTGCGVPTEPEVTFHAAGKTIRIPPTFACDLRGENCADRGAPAQLKVPAGQVVQISVPGELANGRWEVAYTYIDRDPADPQKSQVVGSLSENILGRGENFAYTVTVPKKDNQLVQIEVREAAAAVIEDGSLALRAAWAVDVVPR